MRPDRPAEPWYSFLTDLDAALDGPADFHCIGGFVVSQHYGFTRKTADLDVLTVIPLEAAERVADLAGKGSPLQRKHRVYIDHVGVANYPDDYESRLVMAFPIWPNVRLWALEPHDLALTKLERSNDRDIRDVMYLAQAGLITQGTLISRFETELEPYITGRTPTWNLEPHHAQHVGRGLLAAFALSAPHTIRTQRRQSAPAELRKCLKNRAPAGNRCRPHAR